MEEKNKQNTGENILRSWKVPEFEKHNRPKNWYIIAITVAFLALLFSFMTANFLFAVIVIITALVILLNDNKEPNKVAFSLTSLGIRIGGRFYDYDEFKNFSILYKPQEDIKSLYFEFDSSVRPRLSVSLEKENPLTIREILLDYLEEDLDRTAPPLSEGLAKLLKL